MRKSAKGLVGTTLPQHSAQEACQLLGNNGDARTSITPDAFGLRGTGNVNSTEVLLGKSNV